MIEKQIIIDDIDVSGCCCYENGKCLWTKRYYENNIVPDCKKVKNCYYKQFKRKEQKYLILATLIRNTKTYSDVCDECKDEILLYPSISGRTDYKQIEIEERALKNIINKLKESI